MSQPRRVILFTLFLTAYVMGLVGWVTWIVFTNPPTIPGGTAAAYGSLLGLPAVAVGLYQWARKRDANKH